MSNLEEELQIMVNKLQKYHEEGLPLISRSPSEHVIMVRPEKQFLKPLTKITDSQNTFLAVDCSTRSLKRANNWGIYLLRVAYVLIRNRKVVNWDHKEHIVTLTGSMIDRTNALADARLEKESAMAINLLREVDVDDYVLLDGVSLFGGGRAFLPRLYDECEKKELRLLAIGKRSPSIHDECGRDGMTTIVDMADLPLWCYHPLRKANKDVHLYGDVSIVKLFEGSRRFFRCDVMKYLTDAYEVGDLLSPLTFVSDDARCLGYPVPLYLAHRFTKPHKQQLLYFYDLVNEHLPRELRKRLDIEETAYNFPDELHGVKHPFEWEVFETF